MRQGSGGRAVSSYLSRYIGVEQLPRKLTEFDIEVYFSLPEATIEALRKRYVAGRIGSADRLVGLAVQLIYLRTTGRTFDRKSIVPPALLRYIGEALGVRAPSVASLKAIYSRRQTLNDHQTWCKKHLELSTPKKEDFGALAAMLAIEAKQVTSVGELVARAISWLYDKRLLIPRTRLIREHAQVAFAGVERHAIEVIQAQLPKDKLAACIATVFSKHDGSITVLEWLKAAPKRHSPSTFKETMARVRFLLAMEADVWDLSDIPLVRQRAFAHALLSRPPSESRRRVDTTQMLEIVCFLKVTLLELTDSVLYQAARRVSDLVRRASERTKDRQARTSGEYRASLSNIKDVAVDETRTAEQRLAAIGEICNALGDLSPNSHSAVVRETLIADDGGRIRTLLGSMSGLKFQGRVNEVAVRQLDAWREYQRNGVTELPSDFNLTLPKIWQPAVESDDRKRAMSAFAASTAQALSRGMRRGSVWLSHSLSFRERDEMLISPKEWAKERDRYYVLLDLPQDPDAFLTPLLKHLEAGLAAVDEAFMAERLTIDSEGLHLPKIEALPDDPEPKAVRNLIFKEIGPTQFPDLLLETDSLTHFSEILLGRRARNANELVAVYAALMALGMDGDARGIAGMIPQVDPVHVSTAMRAVELYGRLDRANERVTQFQRKHSITTLWGTGEIGSSDMMSLEASRHLWNARVDPRRRTYAIGVYSHVLDSHGIVHNLPVVLNERQAGVAIEGVVRHNTSDGLETRLTRLAVDTHGYTNPGMAVAKFVGFDLCPQLRSLTERKLYLPRSMQAPESIEAIIVRDVSLKPIRKAYDDLVRVAASVRIGRASAHVVMQRLGSAARGDCLHAGADQLGRLLRSLFLCDYFSNPNFRREIHTVLNRGESVHQLQRAVHTGKIGHARGRRKNELTAISGAHTLLTNIVVAWNTHRMQAVVEHWRKTGREIDDKWLARMGPAHYRHINFRGLLEFGVEPFAPELLSVAPIAARPARKRSA